MTICKPLDSFDTDFYATDLTWAEQIGGLDAAAPKVGRVLRAPVAAETCGSQFVTSADGPEALAMCGRFREWMLSGGFSTVALPHWDGATIWAYREAVSLILAMLPESTVTFEPAAQSIALRLQRIWPNCVRTHRDPALPLRCGPVAVAEDAPTGAPVNDTQTCLEELTRALSEFRSPELPSRVEARLVHLRESAAAPLVRRSGALAKAPHHADAAYMFGLGAEAANAVIPQATSPFGAGLHLGGGYVLTPACGPAGPSSGGYTLSQVTTDTPEDQEAPAPLIGLLRSPVAVDPRPGKVLKHETAHALFVGEHGRVCVALSTLRMIGRGARHNYFQDTGAVQLPSAGCFIFNESWKFVGLGCHRFPPKAARGQRGPVIAALRTGAIWDDLVIRADLGSAEAADALAHLALWDRPVEPRLYPKIKPVGDTSRLVASPARVGGSQ